MICDENKRFILKEQPSLATCYKMMADTKNNFDCIDHFLTIDYQLLDTKKPAVHYLNNICHELKVKKCAPNNNKYIPYSNAYKTNNSKDVKSWKESMNIKKRGSYTTAKKVDAQKAVEKGQDQTNPGTHDSWSDVYVYGRNKGFVGKRAHNHNVQRDEYYFKDVKTWADHETIGRYDYEDMMSCCRDCCDVYDNCNNNSAESGYSMDSMGNNPLTVLKKERNSWTLVPVSEIDARRNQSGGCQNFEDWPGSQTMNKGVYLETPHIDFLICMARSGQSHAEIMSRCETALMAADVNNVTESYLIAAKYGMQNVMDTLLELIRDNFILVSQTKQFLELPVDLMELFLSDTLVNVGDELDVFAAALRWVDYNKQERLCQSGRVLNCIRYEKIHPVDIRDHVEPNIHLFNGPCGAEALVNIYRKHALDCVGVDDYGPLGLRPTHDELVEEIQMKPATAPGREHAIKIAQANPSGKVAAAMKAKGPGKVAGGAKKDDGKPKYARGKGKREQETNDKNVSRSQQVSNNHPPTTAGARVWWRDGNEPSNGSRGGSFSKGNGKSLSRERASTEWRVSVSHADPSPEGFPPRPRR